MSSFILQLYERNWLFALIVGLDLLRNSCSGLSEIHRTGATNTYHTVWETHAIPLSLSMFKRNSHTQNDLDFFLLYVYACFFQWQNVGNSLHRQNQFHVSHTYECIDIEFQHTAHKAAANAMPTEWNSDVIYSVHTYCHTIVINRI